MSGSAMLSVFSSGLGAAGTVASTYAQSEASRLQGNFEKKQADQNARLLDLQAKDIEKQGDKEASQHRKKVSGMVGSQRAALAAQGINIDAGTAKDIQDETQIFGAEDAETIRLNAYKQAWGVNQQAEQERSKGRIAKIGAKFDSATTLATGGLQFAGQAIDTQGKYKDYKAGKSVAAAKTKGTK